MSIAVLTQVYDETRRLAIAGSVVASGDFRLKKLIAPLEQAGAKAPVFAKAAQAVKDVVESTKVTSAQALLELCTLVNAVLYTQGETGLKGALEPLVTMNVGLLAAPVNAETLKQIIEALTTNGSGRVHTIRAAITDGAFLDVRLVQPALEALDCTYAEVADLVATEVLPLYGKAILSEVKANFNLQGKHNDVRRFILLNAIDPEGSRDLVKQALNDGSKDLRIAAISRLGSDEDDLNTLVEQTRSDIKDVRTAAFNALGTRDAKVAVETLKTALIGKDLSFAIDPIKLSKNPDLLQFAIGELQREIDSLVTSTNQKDIAKSATRIETLLGCLPGHQDQSTETFLLLAFALRAKFLKLAGEKAGLRINHRIAQLMCDCSEATVTTLAAGHAQLEADELQYLVFKAHRCLPHAKLYDYFAPYLTAEGAPGQKRQGRAEKRSAIAMAINALWHSFGYYGQPWTGPSNWDPRWLELALDLEDGMLVDAFIVPGNQRANDFLSKEFSVAIGKREHVRVRCGDILRTMVRIYHPDATDFVITFLKRHEPDDMSRRFLSIAVAHLLPDLPAGAVSRVEELLPSLHEDVRDILMEPIAKLKSKA